MLHPPGRHGPYPPHRPLLATRGGLDAPGQSWEPGHDLPYARLRRTWPWSLLRLGRQTLKTEVVNQLVETGFQRYPQGRVTNVHKGQVPSPSQSCARYVATDVVSPPLAVRRIDHSDGRRVTSHSRSHSTARVAHATVEGDTCSGRRVPPAMSKGCKRLRDDGGQATKTFAKRKVVIPAALAQVAGVGKGAGQSIARLTSRPR